jgi:hypothetical protein
VGIAVPQGKDASIDFSLQLLEWLAADEATRQRAATLFAPPPEQHARAPYVRAAVQYAQQLAAAAQKLYGSGLELQQLPASQAGAASRGRAAQGGAEGNSSAASLQAAVTDFAAEAVPVTGGVLQPLLRDMAAGELAETDVVRECLTWVCNRCAPCGGLCMAPTARHACRRATASWRVPSHHPYVLVSWATSRAFCCVWPPLQLCSS